ncbi:MAG: hypothetical protein Q7T91_00790 [Sulfuricurvum sp.]|nr:hypothetical protein [Sulfuricurvum sp.]
MNKTLLALHNEPVDIYEEQKRLKDHLARNREADIESREFEKSYKSLQDSIIEQHEANESLIIKYRDIVKKQEEGIEELNKELLGYLQQKEHYKETIPSSHKTIQELDKLITSCQESIDELSEHTFELTQQLSKLETRASMPLELTISNQSFNEIISNAYNEINQRRESATIFSQSAADGEQYNSELKKRVENYTQMLEALENDSTTVSHETLVQLFKKIVIDYAEIEEGYVGIFEDIAISLPKMQLDFADALQKYTNMFVEMIQAIDDTKDLDDKIRDRRIVKNILNGSLGKYMEGDLPFINYLNFRGALSVVDIEHVSKEVEKGKVKDRGVSELINLLQDHDIQIAYQDAFRLRLFLVEHHKVVEVSTKNNKLDYTKNYLNQHKSLSDKAIAIGTTISSPLRNPSELKVLMHSILEQYSGVNGYARDAMLELLDNQISRLPKKSPSN